MEKKVSTNGRGVTWDIFRVDNNTLEIQRIDEATIRDINGAFESDDDALEYVRGLAHSGDKEAIAAIKKVEGEQIGYGK